MSHPCVAKRENFSQARCQDNYFHIQGSMSLQMQELGLTIQGTLGRGNFFPRVVVRGLKISSSWLFYARQRR